MELTKSFKNIWKRLKNLKEKRSFWWILLLLSILPIFIRLVRPGYFYMQDDLQAFRIFEMDKCFQDLQIPCRWVPDAGYGYGYPQFLFYPPLVYYVGELFHLIGFQFIDAVKILFILGYIFSAFAMFALTRSFLGNWPAYISGLLYSYVPYKAVEVYVRGALSEFWALIFFPLIFLFSYLQIKENKGFSFIGLSLSITGLLMTHALMSMIFFPVLVIWVIYWLWSFDCWKKISGIIYSSFLGLGISAFFVLPLLFERQYVHTESLLGGYFDYRQHFVNLFNLFFSQKWGYGSSGFPNEVINLSTGFVQWVFAIFTLLFSFLLRKRRKRLFSLLLVLVGLELITLFMIHQRSSFVWERLVFLHYLQFPWRFLSLSIFLLSIIGAVGIKLLEKKSYIIGLSIVVFSIILTIDFYKSREWFNLTDKEKFSGQSWQKQQTISIFDYTPIYAKLPPPSRAPELPEVLDGDAGFSEYIKGSDWQKGSLNVNGGGAVLRLPLFDFPGMKVRVDDQKTNYWNNDCRDEPYCMGLITFKLPSGKHIIEARLVNTPIRKIGDLITLFSLLVIVFLRVKPKFYEKTSNKKASKK